MKLISSLTAIFSISILFAIVLIWYRLQANRKESGQIKSTKQHFESTGLSCFMRNASSSISLVFGIMLLQICVLESLRQTSEENNVALPTRYIPQDWIQLLLDGSILLMDCYFSYTR